MRSHVLGALVASLCVSALATPAANATPIVFREGITNDYVTNYAGTADTSIYIANGDPAANGYNYGGITSIASIGSTGSRRRILLRFDLTSLSGQGATVQSATVRLTKSSNPGATTTPLVVNAFDLAAANVGWIEGRGAGTDVLDGEPTGRFKAHPGTTWASGGGTSFGGAADVNGTTPDATVTWVQSDAANTTYDFVLPASIIQGWIDDPSTNAGLMFNSTTNTAAFFASSEHATEAWRPTLIIDAVVPEPGVLGLAAAGLPMLLARRRRSN